MHDKEPSASEVAALSALPEQIAQTNALEISRRGLFRYIALATYAAGGYVSEGGTNSVLENARDAIDLGQRLSGFLSGPTGKELVDGAYNHTMDLYISTRVNTVLNTDGDSMNLSDGKLASEPGDVQPLSWPADVANDGRKALSTIAKRTGEPVGTITYANRAWPGSSTRGLVGKEAGFGNNSQLGSPQVEADITADPRQQIITIGLNGNNWKHSGDLAVRLYQQHPAFKQFLDKVSKNPSSLLTRAEAFKMLVTNRNLRNDLNQLLDTIEQDDKEYATGIAEAMAIVSHLDDRRREAGLSGIDLIVTLPIQLGLRDVVPQVVEPRGGSGGKERTSSAPESLNISNVPTARDAILDLRKTPLLA